MFEGTFLVGAGQIQNGQMVKGARMSIALEKGNQNKAGVYGVPYSLRFQDNFFKLCKRRVNKGK